MSSDDKASIENERDFNLVEDFIVQSQASADIFKPLRSSALNSTEYLAAVCSPFQGEIERLWKTLTDQLFDPKDPQAGFADVMAELQFFYLWMLSRTRGGYLLQTPQITWIGRHGPKHQYFLLVRLATPHRKQPYTFMSFMLTVAKGDGFAMSQWREGLQGHVDIWLKRHGIPKKRKAKAKVEEPLPWEDQEVDPDPPEPGSQDGTLDEMFRHSY